MKLNWTLIATRWLSVGVDFRYAPPCGHVPQAKGHVQILCHEYVDASSRGRCAGREFIQAT